MINIIAAHAADIVAATGYRAAAIAAAHRATIICAAHATGLVAAADYRAAAIAAAHRALIHAADAAHVILTRKVGIRDLHIYHGPAAVNHAKQTNQAGTLSIHIQSGDGFSVAVKCTGIKSICITYRRPAFKAAAGVQAAVRIQHAGVDGDVVHHNGIDGCILVVGDFVGEPVQMPRGGKLVNTTIRCTVDDVGALGRFRRGDGQHRRGRTLRFPQHHGQAQNIAAVGQDEALRQDGPEDVRALVSPGLHGEVRADPVPKGQLLPVQCNGGGQQFQNIVIPRDVFRAGKGQHRIPAVRVDDLPFVHPFPVGDDLLLWLVGFGFRLGALRADKAAGLTLHSGCIAAGFIMGGMDTGGDLCHAAGFLRANMGAGVRRLFLPLRGEHAVAVALRPVDMGTGRGEAIAVVAADMGAGLPLHSFHVAAFRGMGRMVLAQPVPFFRESEDRQQGKHHCPAQRQRQQPPGRLGFHPFSHKHRSFFRA